MRLLVHVLRAFLSACVLACVLARLLAVSLACLCANLSLRVRLFVCGGGCLRVCVINGSRVCLFV